MLRTFTSCPTKNRDIALKIITLASRNQLTTCIPDVSLIDRLGFISIDFRKINTLNFEVKIHKFKHPSPNSRGLRSPFCLVRTFLVLTLIFVSLFSTIYLEVKKIGIPVVIRTKSGFHVNLEINF